MERLTRKLPGGYAMAEGYALDTLKGVRAVVNRLAAYEDTGLEPEEMLSGIDMAKIACALHELNAYKDLGPIDRLRELAQADREGRCVVFAPGYPVVSAYYKDEDGVFVRDVTGVVTEEEYKDALRGEQE